MQLFLIALTAAASLTAAFAQPARFHFAQCHGEAQPEARGEDTGQGARGAFCLRVG